jgi:hypothetical protein
MMKTALLVAALALTLGACSEHPQTASAQKRSDAAPYVGTGKVFADAGWKAGDKASWEEHLKVRAQRGQNDYYGRKN